MHSANGLNRVLLQESLENSWVEVELMCDDSSRHISITKGTNFRVLKILVSFDRYRLQQIEVLSPVKRLF